LNGLTSILAGNAASVTVTFAAVDGGAFAPVTAAVAVTKPDGISTTIVSPTVTYNVGNTAATITATWNIPDNAIAGTYTFTIDLSGGLIAAAQYPFRVVARVLPTVVP
jgi:uncharacterized protein YfaS (alpha-2-macroglobulin family)